MCARGSKVFGSGAFGKDVIANGNPQIWIPDDLGFEDAATLGVRGLDLWPGSLPSAPASPAWSRLAGLLTHPDLLRQHQHGHPGHPGDCTYTKLVLVWNCWPKAGLGRTCALSMIDQEKGMFSAVNLRTEPDLLKGTNSMVKDSSAIVYRSFGEPFSRIGINFSRRARGCGVRQVLLGAGQGTASCRQDKVPHEWTSVAAGWRGT